MSRGKRQPKLPSLGMLFDFFFAKRGSIFSFLSPPTKRRGRSSSGKKKPTSDRPPPDPPICRG